MSNLRGYLSSLLAVRSLLLLRATDRRRRDIWPVGMALHGFDLHGSCRACVARRAVGRWFVSAFLVAISRMAYRVAPGRHFCDGRARRTGGVALVSDER
jgi:hypothetical protein